MDNKHNEQSKERCVVFLADAIVEKNAVMVESFNASVTSTTVVTGLGHLGLATLAGDQLFALFFVVFIFETGVRGVAEAEYHVVVDHDDESDSVEGVDNEKYD